jgi:hypothetical protein
MTMKVPPTSSAASAIVQPFSHRLGTMTPIPISSCEAAHTCSLVA